MSTENSSNPIEIDLDAWRREVEVFAEETQLSLGAIGDMLRSAAVAGQSTRRGESIADHLHPETGLVLEPADLNGRGRLNQLKAKLAQKISEKPS